MKLNWIELSIGSKALGNNNNDLPTGAQGHLQNFPLCVLAKQGKVLMVLKSLMLKHHMALSWKVPECSGTIRLSSCKDLKNSVWVLVRQPGGTVASLRH